MSIYFLIFELYRGTFDVVNCLCDTGNSLYYLFYILLSFIFLYPFIFENSVPLLQRYLLTKITKALAGKTPRGGRRASPHTSFESTLSFNLVFVHERPWTRIGESRRSVRLVPGADLVHPGAPRIPRRRPGGQARPTPKGDSSHASTVSLVPTAALTLAVCHGLGAEVEG